MSDTERQITISLVIPVFSGEDTLEDLVSEIETEIIALATQRLPITIVETIFVVDDAKDNSFNVLQQLMANFPWITVLNLSNNFGQHPATIAGVLHTSGDWTVTMDEDLQHPPCEIITMLRKAIINELDIVYAQPLNTVHRKSYRDLASRAFKLLMRHMTGNDNLTNINSFRLVRGSIARAAAAVCSHETYFDIALMWFSERISAVPMMLEDKRFITNKKSGYTLRSLLSHARRMLITSRLYILRLATFSGGLMFIASITLAIFLTIRQILFPELVAVRGWTSLTVITLIIGGGIISLIGIALEYISILVQRANGRPVFFLVDRSCDKILLNHIKNTEP